MYTCMPMCKRCTLVTQALACVTDFIQVVNDSGRSVVQIMWATPHWPTLLDNMVDQSGLKSNLLHSVGLSTTVYLCSYYRCQTCKVAKNKISMLLGVIEGALTHASETTVSS